MWWARGRRGWVVLAFVWVWVCWAGRVGVGGVEGERVGGEVGWGLESQEEGTKELCWDWG